MDARHRLICDIYKFKRLRNRYYRYTPFQWWCGFFISTGNSTENTTEPWMLVQMHMTNERYQQNTTATSDRLDLRWQLGFQWHRRGIELVLQVPRLFHIATVSQCDHFLLLHMCMYLFEASPGWLLGLRGFFYLNLCGGHSAPMYLLLVPYTDL